MTSTAEEQPPLSFGGLWDAQPWSIDALCAQTDPEAFFPEKGGSTRDAKAVCRTCPVQVECLDWALEHNERFGIWGGLSERERRKVLAGTVPKPTFHIVKTGDTAGPPPATPTPETPAMPHPAPPTQPSYVDQIVTVMVATEGHESPAVRAARKVVANALVALNKAVRAAEEGPAEPDPPKPAASKGAASRALRERIERLGTTPADVREYARSQGHQMANRGQLPSWAVDLYEQHHQPQAS